MESLQKIGRNRACHLEKSQLKKLGRIMPGVSLVLIIQLSHLLFGPRWSFGEFSQWDVQWSNWYLPTYSASHNVEESPPRLRYDLGSLQTRENGPFCVPAWLGLCHTDGGELVDELRGDPIEAARFAKDPQADSPSRRGA